MEYIYFEDKTIAFENPHIVYEKKSIYYLEGDNGSGKTTYFKDYNLKFENSLYLSQNFYDFIFDWKPLWWNVSLPLLVKKNKNQCVDKVAELLNKFKLNDINVNSKVHTLSGGEKHIIVLLRFLFFVDDINIMFLDEPETGLDLKNKRIFWDILFDNSHDYTIVLTSHNLIRNNNINKSEIANFNGINNTTLKLYKLTKLKT